jgi:thioredoxin 1
MARCLAARPAAEYHEPQPGPEGLATLPPGVWTRAGALPGAGTNRSQGESMASEKVQTFTDGNFDSVVLKAAAPVLVDFWAEWCGPCRMIAPAIDALAGELEGKAVVGKLNVDDYPEISTRYGVRSIPTLLVFKNGSVVDSMVGVADKNHLKQMLERHV